MGVYINGMEMPNKKNGAVLIIYPGGECAFEDGKTYPAVPVQPHGRLIDADALDDILADQSEDAYNRTHAPRSWEKALSAMRDYLDNAPTIIPAEEGK